MRALRIGVVVLAAVSVASLVTPRPARACGGFFCSNIPVDQSAERIIFAQVDNQIRAWVQIVFNGSAEDFAWVVPVAATPRLDVADSIIFTDLDQATGPVIIPPACAMPMFDADGAPASEGGAGGSRNDDGVIIYDESDVGPYSTATVGSDDASALINWLNENDYVITEAMYPMVHTYVNEGTLFLAMKLQPGQGVDALQPIVMTYQSTRPVIPIRLTAVAADPNMGILVWILGNARAVSANYTSAPIDPIRIRFNDFLQSNYRALVTQTVDEAGGHAFVTEYAGPTANVPVFDDRTRTLITEYPYITRLYTTMSPEEMTEDPVFTFNTSLGDVSNIIDLSERSDLCEDPANSPCDFNYCGPNATCYVANGAPACECESGFVARGVADPVLGTAITCVPEDRNLLEDVTGDPCASVACGELGQCVNVNGTATCGCERGAIASFGDDGFITCSELGLAEVGPREAVVNPQESPAGSEMACSAVGGRSLPVSALVILAAVLGLVFIRRR